MRFRSKPSIVEAFRYNVDPRPDWFQDRVTKNEVVTFEDRCNIVTLEGVMTGLLGDWIIKGLKGELYPCKPDIFALRWEAIE